MQRDALKRELAECRRELDEYREQVRMRWALAEELEKLLGVGHLAGNEQFAAAVAEVKRLKNRCLGILDNLVTVDEEETPCR